MSDLAGRRPPDPAAGRAPHARIGALITRADALHGNGRLTAAEAIYRKAAALAPRAPKIHFGWATVLADLGRLEDAARLYRDVLAMTPAFAEAHVNLGTVLRDLGQLDEAVSEFDAALKLKPEIAFATVELVSALCALDRPREAFDRAVAAMRRDSRSSDSLHAFALVAARDPQLSSSTEIAGFLERCLSSDVIEPGKLAKACAWQLRQRYRIDPVPPEAAARAVDDAIAAGAAGCFGDPLLLRLLAATVSTDPELERFLTEVRRRLFLAPNLPASLRPFLAAMALQCFNNGYVFAVGAEEEAGIAALRPQIEDELARAIPLDSGLEQKLLRFALYEPLTTLVGAARLLDAKPVPTPPLRMVISRCLAEPLQEVELAREIPHLGAIENAVSRAVREQYEAHPYPRWLSLPRISPTALPAILRRKFPRAPLPTFLEGPAEILVAGCGTGRQPITTALSIPQARVLAVDLSSASLGYAKRMAVRLGASNVSFLHADLLDLGKLGREFAVVEAVGVLHHMEDPMAGWRALCGLLRPGGFMLVGLYSALARTDVVAARALIADLGAEPTARDIRAFRQRVLFGDERGRLPRLALSKDMYDLNGCRDLLFHVQEHRYTLPELDAMIGALGLEFLGFDLLEEHILRRYRAENRDDPTASSLASWARFEEAHPDTFSGMYVFWCRKPLAR